MLYTNADRGTKEGNGVLRDELLEGDEESGLEGNVTINDGVPGYVSKSKRGIVGGRELTLWSDCPSQYTTNSRRRRSINLESWSQTGRTWRILDWSRHVLGIDLHRK